MRDEELPGSEGIRPLKRVEYERLVDCGVFAGEPIELLRGFLVWKYGNADAGSIARTKRCSDLLAGTSIPEELGDSIRPLKRVEYEQGVECGLFADERIELLHGFLVRMSPQGERHWKSITLLHKVLVLALRDRADVVSHSPFAAADDSEPEPDLQLVPPIGATHGAPTRAFLVVEASDSSLRKDRELKAPLYAASGVPEYWILDLNANEVEVQRDPGPEGYRSITRHGADATLNLLAFPDVSLRVSAFLPRD